MRIAKEESSSSAAQASNYQLNITWIHETLLPPLSFSMAGV